MAAPVARQATTLLQTNVTVAIQDAPHVQAPANTTAHYAKTATILVPFTANSVLSNVLLAPITTNALVAITVTTLFKEMVAALKNVLRVRT